MEEIDLNPLAKAEESLASYLRRLDGIIEWVPKPQKREPRPTPAPARRTYRPRVFRGKTYTPNGAREIARRTRQAAAARETQP